MAPEVSPKALAAALFIIGLIIGLGIGYVAAPPRVVEVTKPPEVVELTMCYPTWWADYWYWKEVLAPEFIGLMAEKGVYVKIKFVEYPSPDEPYRDKLFADMKAGTAPDIVLVDSFWVPALAVAGYLYDLTDLVEAWEWDQYYKPMQDMVSWEGRVYAIMLSTDVRPLYYRRDILEAAGVIGPGEKWEPETLDEVLEAARKVKEWAEREGYEIYPIALKAGVLGGEATTMQGFYMVLLAYGGRLYDFETGKWIAESTPLLRTLEFYYKIYVEEGLSVPPEFWLTGKPVDKIHEYLRDGKLAIFPTWDGVWYDTGRPEHKWYITKNFRGEPATRDEVLDYTIMPGAEPGAISTISGGWSIAIYAKAGERGTAELAWEFLKFAMSRGAYARRLVLFGGLPPRKDVAEDPFYKSRVDEYTVWRTTVLLPHTTFRPGLPEYMKVSELVQKATEKILRGERPEDVMEWYRSELIKIVGEENVEELP